MAARNLLVGLSLALLAHILLIQSTICQVTDGDEQFQAYHEDIGRISGMQQTAQVAPQSTIITREQQQQQQSQLRAPEPDSLNNGARFQSFSNNNNQQQQVAAVRKPNRVTLAVRRDSLPLPGQQQVIIARPQQEEPSPSLIPAQLPAPQAAPLSEPTFAPLAPPPLPLQAQQARPQAATFSQSVSAPDFGPALASFRGAQPQVAGPSQQVASATIDSNARHAALMAQVAAERAAAAAAASQAEDSAAAHNHHHAHNRQHQQHHQQHSLGSPIAALSQPAASQIQPPVHHSNVFVPTSQQQHQSFAQPQAAAPSPQFVDQPEEPLVAPSFEHVLQRGCPQRGVFSYENKDFCDRYYMCTNGTFTEEACPNGLAYGQMGAVYQHCAYNWNVDCGRKKSPEPIASAGCPWQFGIFPIVSNGQCSIDYFVCEWGVPETKRCSPEGLFYDDRIKGCQWADQLGCKSEALLNFKCPQEDEDNPYWPYPRYYHNSQDVIVCVNEQPRLVHCNEDQLVDPSSLACVDVKKKKVKKF